MKYKYFVLVAFMIVHASVFGQTLIKQKNPVSNKTRENSANVFQMRVDWNIHSRFIPMRNFSRDEANVNGYNRHSHRYLDSYIHPAGYGVTLKLIVDNIGLGSGDIVFKWEISGIVKDDLSANPFYHTVTTNKKILYAGSSTSVDTEQDVMAMPRFPFRGTYKVVVSAFEKVPSTKKFNEIKRIEQVVEVKDRLVVVMGDSFASGEGNPDSGGVYSTAPDIIIDDFEAVWLEPNAHRSFTGALSLIAASIEADDPHSCVTFINVATSGAKTSSGLIFQQDPDWQWKGQIQEVKDYVKNRQIDVILLSIGLNDFGKHNGMSDLIIAAANPGPPEFARSEEFTYSQRVLDNMQFRYDEVFQKITNTLSCKNVVLFQMPILFMRDSKGAETDGCGALIAMEKEDIRRLESIGNQFIQLQKQVCAKYGWVYIDGISELFKNHGYCAGSESWFVSVSRSRGSQGDTNGSVHPNTIGHQKIADLAFPVIKRRIQSVTVPTRPGNTIISSANGLNK